MAVRLRVALEQDRAACRAALAITDDDPVANLSLLIDAISIVIENDAGAGVQLIGADESFAGLLTSANFVKLQGIASGATANATNAELRDRSTHTGTQTSSTISDFAESVRDTVAAALVAGSNITITPDDAGDTITIASSGGGGGGGTGDVTGPSSSTNSNIAVFSGGTGKVLIDGGASIAATRQRHTHTGTQTASTISDFAETVRDTMGTALVAGANITLTVSDVLDTITIASSGGGSGSTQHYDTRADAASATIDAAVDSIWVAGLAAVDDLGDGLYKRVGSAPSHAGKFQSADGAHWELTGFAVRPEQFSTSVGSTGIDNAMAYLAAKGGGFVHLKGLSYTRGSTITVPASNIHFWIEPYTVLDFSTVTASNNWFNIWGTAGTDYSILAQAPEGTRLLTLDSADAANFAEGDMVRIWSNVVFDEEAESIAGEINFVESVTGGTIKLHGALDFTYEVSGTNIKGATHFAKIEKWTPKENVKIHGGVIRSDVAVDSQLSISFWGAIRCGVEDVYMNQIHFAGISWRDSVDCTVDNCHFNWAIHTGSAYGVTGSSSAQDILVTNCHFYRCRHAISMGSQGGYGGMPRRFKFVDNFVMISEPPYVPPNFTGSGDAVDTHSSAGTIEVRGNTIFSASGAAISLQGNGAIVQNNHIWWSGQNATNVGGSINLSPLTFIPGVYEVTDNTIHGCPNAGIRVATTVNPTGDANTRTLGASPNRVLIANNTIEFAGNTPIVIPKTTVTTDTATYVSNRVKNLTIVGNNCSGVTTSGSIFVEAADDFIIANNTAELTSGTTRDIIRVIDSKGGAINGNTCRLPSGSTAACIGIYSTNAGDSDHITITGNVGRSPSPSNSKGIYIAATTSVQSPLNARNIVIGKNDFSECTTAISMPVITISGDAITIPGDVGLITIDTEGSAATDNLSTINGGMPGQTLLIRTNNSARDVVIKNGTGNITNGADFTLTSPDMVYQLYKPQTGNWLRFTPDTSGAGDVVGPSSSVSNRLASFASTTGKLIADSGATLADVRTRSTHTGTQTAATISDFSEAVDDRVGSLLTSSASVSFTYNDAAGTITAAVSGTGRLWINATESPYNALGNGVNDDTAEIQAALNAAETAGGGIVYLPVGDYRCSSTINIPQKVHLMGEDMNNTLITATSTQASVVSCKTYSNQARGTSLSNVTLVGNSNTLYGLKVPGVLRGQWRNVTVQGLTATTGAGYNNSERAWAFYFHGFADGSNRIQSQGNLVENIYSNGNPNGVSNASVDHTTDGGGVHGDGSPYLIGGLNNIFMNLRIQNFSGIGMEIWGEANLVMTAQISTNADNTYGMRVNDAVTTLINVDCDCSYNSLGTPGFTAGGTDPVWGLPLGVKDNNSVGFWFKDTASCLVIMPQGNGNRTRMSFENDEAYQNTVIWGRAGYMKLGRGAVGGYPTEVPGSFSASTASDRTHAGSTLRFSGSGAKIYTVSPDSTYDLMEGTEIELIRTGNGSLTVAAGAGVTVQSAGSLLGVGPQHGVAKLRKIGANTWNLSGNLV